MKAPVTAFPQSPIQRVVGQAVAGAEVALQDLLQVTSVLTRDGRQEALDPGPGAMQFHNAPITYDGHGNGRRRSPTEMTRLFVIV